MPRITLPKRKIVIERAKNGDNQCEIAKKFNISRSSVQEIIKKYLGVVDRPRSGRPRKLSIHNERILVCESKKFPKKTADTLRISCNMTQMISVDTVKKK
jgi:transposase